MPLTWQDSRPIGELLFEKFGDKDPLTVRFTDLHKAVTELPGDTSYCQGPSDW